MGCVLIWVPASWVATGLTGLSNTDVEIVGLGRDVGQTGDVGDVEVPDSVAGVEFYVPSFFPSAAGGGPIQVSPASITAVAKAAFSARKP